MTNAYEKMVKELGEDGARAVMRERRSKVVNPGFASMDKKKLSAISKLGAAKRWGKDDKTDNTRKHSVTKEL